MKQRPKSNTHQSVGKALEILMAFTPANQEIGTAELSEKLGYHKSTVSRLLHVLEAYGFLWQHPKTRKYNLGESAAEVGRTVTQSLGGRLIKVAQPYIDDLRNSVRETVGLEVMSGHSTIMAYNAPVPELLRVIFDVGARLPIHVAVGARAILAFSEPDVVDSLLKGKLKRFTPNTVTDAKVLKSRLKDFRRRGFAADFGEFDINVYAIGAPIFNHAKRPVAAVVIAAMAGRMKSHLKSNVIISSLKETAAAISSQLLYPKE
jgi:DNA-binding IclR family transcriptional regulator